MNASAQSRRSLFPARFRGRMDLGTDPGTLGGVPLGRMAAMLSEAVIMLVAMIVAARWVIRRFDVPRTLPATMPTLALVTLSIRGHVGVIF